MVAGGCRPLNPQVRAAQGADGGPLRRARPSSHPGGHSIPGPCPEAPARPTNLASTLGGVAQLVERYVRNVEVGGSSPLTSTLCFESSRLSG